MVREYVLVTAALMIVSSCGNSGPKADGQRWCELEKEIEKARAEGDRIKASELKQERRALYQEMEEKYEHDEKATNELEAAYQECRLNSGK